EDEAVVVEPKGAQDEEGGLRHRPNITFTNRLRAMDDRLGDIDTNIYKLSNNVEDLTYVVSGMSEQVWISCPAYKSSPLHLLPLPTRLATFMLPVQESLLPKTPGMTWTRSDSAFALDQETI
nr:hypothetical protein [Tanacetum cinerariifolium]